MNTIEEILKKKRQECKNCRNRFNILDLCKITVTKENEAQCINFEKCMKNQCKTCVNKNICDKEENYVSKSHK